MATNYGLCIVIASLSIVTVMVRSCAWCRNWRGGVRGGELGSGEWGELGERICFYCDEYQLLWDSLETVGQIEDAVPDNPRITIRAATLPKICAAGLCGFIDAVVEVDGVRTTARIRLR